MLWVQNGKVMVPVTRSAYDLGYNVVLVVDAMTDRDADAHRISVEKIFPRLGETTKTDDVLKALKEAPGELTS
jgi:isochorismate hydrolase